MGLEDKDDIWVTNENKLLDVVMSYFLDIFTASQVTDATAIYEKVSGNVSHNQNVNLLLPFRDKEVWNAIKAMSLVEALGFSSFILSEILTYYWARCYVFLYFSFAR